MPATDGAAVRKARPARLGGRVGLAFLIVAVLAIATLWIGQRLSHCYGDDAAGCGMTSGIAELISYALSVLVGLATLIYLIPHVAARSIAWLIVGGVTLVAGVELQGTLSMNWRVAGTLDGEKPQAADEPLRGTIRCLLLAEVEPATDRTAARDFDGMANFYAGRISLLDTFAAYPKTLAIVREEGRKLHHVRDFADANAGCVDLTEGADVTRDDWLRTAGYDPGDVQERRDDAYAIAPKPDPAARPAVAQTPAASANAVGS